LGHDRQHILAPAGLDPSANLTLHLADARRADFQVRSNHTGTMAFGSALNDLTGWLAQFGLDFLPVDCSGSCHGHVFTGASQYVFQRQCFVIIRTLAAPYIERRQY
jgi:hypothetical protein